MKEEGCEKGVNNGIYANHLLEALTYMVNTAKSILLNGRSSECDRDMLSIKEAGINPEPALL